MIIAGVCLLDKCLGPIRTFVSSTFADMQQERDELILRVFPLLRQQCEERGVMWGEVDLRWGITREEIDEGRLLPTCFARIDEYRPFFVALLGTRYGHRVTIPPSVLNSEPWLAPFDGRSATELEIRYALKHEEGRRFFFFVRDHAGETTTPADREALHELETLIAAAGHRLRPYRTTTDCGEMARRDMAQAIDELIPPHDTKDAAAEEELRQQSFAARFGSAYVPIGNMFDRLDRRGGHGKGVLVVTGSSGTGKSALLANWIEAGRIGPYRRFDWRNAFRQKPASSLIMTHFVEASPRSSDWSAILMRFSIALRDHLQVPFEPPTDPDALRVAFASLLLNVSSDVYVTLIIDGLDHLRDRDNALELAWLPETLPENVSAILSTRPGRTDAEIRRRGYASIELPPLNRHEQRLMIAGVLGEFGKNLSEATVVEMTLATDGHPAVFIRLLLEELRVFGDYDRLEATISDYLSVSSTEELCGRIISRLERHYPVRPHLVADTLAFLATAHDGLTEGELLELNATSGTVPPPAKWAPLYFALKPFLIDRGGVLAISRPEFRTAIAKHYMAEERSGNDVRRRLTNYFRVHQITERGAAEFGAQLEALGEWESLVELLATADSFRRLWKSDPDRMVAWWRMVESRSPFRAADAYRSLGLTAIDAAVSACDLLLRIGRDEEALEIATGIERDSGGARNEIKRDILNRRSIALRRLGRVADALIEAEHEERICRDAGDRARLAASLGNQAALLRDLDRPIEAAGKLKEEEQICRALGDYRGLMINLGNRSTLAFDAGNLDAALKLAAKQETLARRLGDRLSIARSAAQTGVMLGKLGEISKARERMRESELIFRQLSDLQGLQRCLGQIAVIERRRADYDRVKTLLDEQEAICRRLGDGEALAHSLAQRASFYAIDLGAVTIARPVAVEARSLAQKHGLTRLALDVDQLILALNRASR